MREKLISITIDYETWNPLPVGETVDWEANVFWPAEQLMRVAERCGIPITFFAEMGEYLWLEKYEPTIAERMATQLQEAAFRGHDVQLHLHPNWLPESGARVENGQWWWDSSLQAAGLYPGDVTDIIARCKAKLEEIVKIAKPDYRVSCFRCGGYSAQPFDRVYDALAANGIYCDSSVYLGGCDASRGYDFRFAWSAHQPYYADRFDPQLKAPSHERDVIELPVFAWDRSQRWCLDGDGAKALVAQFRNHQARISGDSSVWLRAAVSLIEHCRWPARPRRALERNLRRRLYAPIAEDSLPSEYFVMIGHTKGRLEFGALQGAIEQLGSIDCKFESLNFLAERSRVDLECLAAVFGRSKEITDPLMCPERLSMRLASSGEFADRIPLDRKRILLPRFREDRTKPIAILRPWAKVTQCVIDPPKAGAVYSGIEQYSDEVFDCVHGPHLLQSHPDPDKVLAEAFRVLSHGGLLLTILPRVSQERRLFPRAIGSYAAANAILGRMKRAGFVNLAICEIDANNEFHFRAERRTRRRFRDAMKDAIRRWVPWVNWRKPSQRFIALTGWKRPQPIRSFDRVLEAMNWVYETLSPAAPSAVGLDPNAIIRGGKGLCIDYCVVLGALLRNEGIDVEWVTMVAHDHPRGSGAERQDTHEVLQVRVDGCTAILDPMTNNWHGAELLDLLREPSIAVPPKVPDHRYIERGYALYDTAEWYSRVTRYSVRKDIALLPSMGPWRTNPYHSPYRRRTGDAAPRAIW